MYTAYAWSEEPFLLVAAVQKLPASYPSKGSTDFGSFMPVPMLYTGYAIKYLSVYLLLIVLFFFFFF